MKLLFSEHLDLFVQGIYEISTIPEHYPIHKAIIENDVELLQNILDDKR